MPGARYCNLLLVLVFDDVFEAESQTGELNQRDKDRELVVVSSWIDISKADFNYGKRQTLLLKVLERSAEFP